MKDTIYGCIIAVLIIILIVMGVQLGKGTEKATPRPAVKAGNANSSTEEEFISIHFNEDLSKEGEVEGVDGLTWNHITINEDESTIRADFTLENRTENNIEAKKLKVSLYNKEGIEIATKEIETSEIEANKYEFVNVEFSKEKESDYEVIYDVKITSNKR